jgi:hypothetical protein
MRTRLKDSNMVVNESTDLAQALHSVEESPFTHVCDRLATCAGYAVGFNFGSAINVVCAKDVDVPEATRRQ